MMKEEVIEEKQLRQVLILMPEEMHLNLKLHSVYSNTSMSEIIRQLLRDQQWMQEGAA